MSAASRITWTYGALLIPRDGHPIETFQASRNGRVVGRVLRAEPWSRWHGHVYDDCCALEGERFARRVDAERAVEAALRHEPHSRCSGTDDGAVGR